MLVIHGSCIKQNLFLSSHLPAEAERAVLCLLDDVAIETASGGSRISLYNVVTASTDWSRPATPRRILFWDSERAPSPLLQDFLLLGCEVFPKQISVQTHKIKKYLLPTEAWSSLAPCWKMAGKRRLDLIRNTPALHRSWLVLFTKPMCAFLPHPCSWMSHW